MRQFESVLVFVAVFAVMWPVVFGVRPRRGIVAGVLAATLVIHLQAEGFRWQMLPLDVLAVGLAIGDVLFMDRELKWSDRVARGVAGLAGVGLAALPAVLLPVPTMPTPSGPSAVGTFSFEVEDPDRVEIHGRADGRARRFMAQVWYPAEPAPDLPALTWSEDWDVVAPAVSEQWGLPGWFLNYTRYTHSNSRESLAPAEGTFPVVIYSHGLAGFRTNTVNQVENLVSNGYVVITIDHTYLSSVTRFPGGDVIPFDPGAVPSEEEAGAEVSAEATEQALFTIEQDIATVVNNLNAGASGVFGSLSEKADLTRIGVYGHGAGGGGALIFCLRDEEQRCDAVLGMDAWVERIPDRVLSIPLGQPALFLRTDDWRDTENDSVLRGIAGRSSSASYWVGVEGAEHNDLLAAPLLTPYGPQLGITGSIPAGTVVPIVNNYLLGFFDVFLLGAGPAALDKVTFDAVTVEVFNP